MKRFSMLKESMISMINYLKTFFSKYMSTPNTSVTLTNNQWEIILDAVEDYGVLVSEEVADKCCEIIEIIEAERMNQN